MDNYKLQMQLYSGVTYKYQSIYKHPNGTYFWLGGRLNGYKTIQGAKIAIGMRIYT